MTAYTSLGSKELHKRHSVMIEGGNVPRAKVMDQSLIDRYLMRGLINVRQFRAGEYVLQQAAIAVMWPRGVRLDGAGKTDPGSTVPYGIQPLGTTMNIVKRFRGWFHAYLLKHVIIDERDIAHDEAKMTIFKQALDCVAKRRMGNIQDPIQSLKRRAA